MIRDIPGYEGRYAATADGQIWSHVSGKFLRPYTDKDGYLIVLLSPSRGVREHRPVARLVAMAFVSIPSQETQQVNHIDGVRDNNRAINLEWVTPAENYKHSVDVLGRTPLRCKGRPVIRISASGDMKHYSCGLDAKRDGFWSSGISEVCTGKRKQYRGYQWRFA